MSSLEEIVSVPSTFSPKAKLVLLSFSEMFALGVVSLFLMDLKNDMQTPLQHSFLGSLWCMSLF
jgi:hypothetical protein